MLSFFWYESNQIKVPVGMNQINLQYNIYSFETKILHCWKKQVHNKMKAFFYELLFDTISSHSQLNTVYLIHIK